MAELEIQKVMAAVGECDDYTEAQGTVNDILPRTQEYH